VSLPLTFCVGLALPTACRALTDAASAAGGRDAPPRAASVGYALESLGGAAAGLLSAFVLVWLLDPARLLLAACCVALTASALACPSAKTRRAVVLAALAAALATAVPGGPARSLQALLDARRWQAFLGAQAAADTRVARSADSPYQNLSLLRRGGASTLYGNGEMLFAWPDEADSERRVHFVMAQHPAAARVLLIGGHPAGEGRELLKYPLSSLTWVEPDPLVGGMVRAAAPAAFDRALADPRLRVVRDDPGGFALRDGEPYDVILVSGPNPVSAAANRFYTVEFYRALRRRLAPRGFLWCRLASAERLEADAAALAAPVLRALREAFPRVLVTAGSELQFFADAGDAELTFDRAELARRSRLAAAPAMYFRPEYFLGCEELDPDKIAETEARLAAQRGAANSVLLPVTYFRGLVLWSRLSGSGSGGWLRRAAGAPLRWAAPAALLAAAVIWGAGRARRRAAVPAGARAAARAALFITGFAGMALQVAQIFVFQGLLGSVYARVGLLVGAFMLGLVAGAPCGLRLAGGAGDAPRRRWLALDAAMLALALALARGAAWAAERGAGSAALEACLYVSVAFTGWLVGAEFPLANRVLSQNGATPAGAAALAAVADQSGAALGALLTGVLCVPLLGVEGALVFVAALKTAGLACLTAARPAAARPGAGTTGPGPAPRSPDSGHRAACSTES
jgi:spermidine synthase